MNLSNYRIKLGKSAYYVRTAISIHAWALVLLFYSALGWPLKLVLALLLALQLAAISKKPFPSSKYQALIYSDSKWSLESREMQQESFERIRLVLDVELFFLLELRGEKKRRYLVIFCDQLSKESYRLLNISEKIH